MATKPKALIGFSNRKDDELLILARTIIAAMTENPHFLTPNPSLEEVQILADDFSAKLVASRKRGSPEDRALKEESKPLLADGLQKLGYYVNTVAQGKLSVLLSSGFVASSTTSSSQIPLVVNNVRFTDGRQSGQGRLDFQPLRKVRIYEYQYRPLSDAASPWSERFSTTTSRGNVIAPLEVGQYYEVRVRAVNTQGPGDWSNTATLLVR